MFTCGFHQKDVQGGSHCFESVAATFLNEISIQGHKVMGQSFEVVRDLDAPVHQFQAVQCDCFSDSRELD